MPICSYLEEQRHECPPKYPLVFPSNTSSNLPAPIDPAVKITGQVAGLFGAICFVVFLYWALSALFKKFNFKGKIRSYWTEWRNMKIEMPFGIFGWVFLVIAICFIILAILDHNACKRGEGFCGEYQQINQDTGGALQKQLKGVQ